MNTEIAENISKLLKKAQLPLATKIEPLGSGELNNSYRVTTGTSNYCIRIAKYEGKKGLQRENDALKRLPSGIGPEIIYFSVNTDPIATSWIIESYIEGVTPKRLTLAQFKDLGIKMAKIHSVPAPLKDIVDVGEVTGNKYEVWKYIMWSCRSFYTEEQILDSMPNQKLSDICRRSRLWLEQNSKVFENLTTKKMLHKDVTMSNLLVRGEEVFLIDWEFRDFGDPMVDFSTGFWELTELNNGKWRTVLSKDEETALYEGYRSGGGTLNEERIAIWRLSDMLGVAIFLSHRLEFTPPGTTSAQLDQYKTDFNNIINSLSQKYSFLK